MNDFPASVAAYLKSLALDSRSPAFFLTTRDGNLALAGGHLAHYGITELTTGTQLGDQVLFMSGLLPLADGFATVIECVQAEDGPPIDLHFFRGPEGDWSILLDGSESERRQRLMQQKGNELSLSYQRLVKETQKKEILLHCIVHDLAGPLMGIRGGFELLGAETLSDQGKDLVDIGLRQATRQEKLIRDILTAFAAEVEQTQAFATDYASAPDALSAAREVVSLLSPAFDLKGVHLQIEFDREPGLDWKVVGEQSRLQRVFSNLIENALRHSPAGSTVTVRLEQGDQLTASIEDQGSGVPPEVASHLFEKFTQGGGKSGKIGLGLYFCRITVEHWGGSMGQEPSPGGGSRFWFKLPRPTSAA